nr:DUF4199 domain-containing protein [uncultured Chitinophaga sp.]
MLQSSNPGVKWGIIAGIVLILLNVGSWIAGHEILFSFLNGIAQMILLIVFAILAGKERKRQVGPYVGFKTMIKPVYTTFIISTLMITVYQFVLYKYIDPDLSEAFKQHTLATTERVLRSFGAPQDQLESQLDSINGTDFSVSFSKSFLDYLRNVIFYFAVSAIIALILRKKAPEQKHS